MSVDPHASGLYPVLDPDWRRKTKRAGWLLFVPLVGWPMVLGYRRALTGHLFRDTEAALPEWRGRHAEHFWNGVRAIGVIQAYIAPVWALFAWWIVSAGYEPGAAAWLALGACLVFPIFTNVALPWSMIAASLTFRGGPYLTMEQFVVLWVAFHAAIFLVPAGFVFVSATGRFRSAFDFTRTLPFIVRRWRGYLRAWWYGLWMNWPILPLVPFCPWLLFWAYVASLLIFNQLLVDEPEREGADRPRVGGWLTKAYGLSADSTSQRVVVTPFFSVPIP